MKRNPKKQQTKDRLPPHSPEAEAGVVGACLSDPNCFDLCRQVLVGTEAFYDVRHRKIWAALEVKAKNGGISVEGVHEILKTDGVNDITALVDLQLKADNRTAMLPLWLDIVVEKYRLRTCIKSWTDMISRVYEYRNIDDFVEVTRGEMARLSDMLTPAKLEDTWPLDELYDFEADCDPNAVIGLTQDGRASRYLCRAYGAWLIGPSGVGKSSFIHQAAFSWALGLPFLGITPVRPLRVLVVQAENDKGDAAEMTQGILRSLGVDRYCSKFETLQDAVKVVTERRTVGAAFCRWLERQIQVHRADIVFADPFLSFAGIDVARLDACTNFLRHSLNPVLIETGAVLFASHHTGKPKTDKNQRTMTAIEYAYQGIGSSELVNWARAVMTMIQIDDNHYLLRLAKRGDRAKACHPGGEITKDLYLQHAKDRIYWEQIEAPQPPPPKAESEKRSGGKPSIVREIAASNLHSFLSGCTCGEGLNVIAKRLEVWLATQKKDASRNTCKRVIPLLVENGKLIKTPDLVYQKGPNA